MKLFIPQSIFAGIAVYNLSDKILQNIESRPTSMLIKELEADKCDVALIPTFDLIKRKDVFISRRAGVSFDGSLSNSFLYFKKNLRDVAELFLAGDVSSNEIFLSKIVFEEFYDSTLNFTLETKQPDFGKHNYLIAGNMNFENDLFSKGISMAEQVSEFLDYPLVSFVFASKNKEAIEELNKQFENIDERIEDKLTKILGNLKLSDKATQFIQEHFNEVYFQLTDNELEGMNEMLKIPYYKGIVDDLIELNLI